MKILKEKLARSKVGLFKKIGEILLKPMDIEKIKIEQKVDKLLNTDLIEIVMEYYLSGYTLTKSQEKIFINQIDKLNSHVKLQFLDNKISKGIWIQNEELINYYPDFIKGKLQYKTLREDGTTKTSDAEITKLYRRKIKDKDFQIDLFKYINMTLNEINSNNSVKKEYFVISEKKLENIYKIIERYGDVILDNVNIEQIIQLNDRLKSIHDKYQQLKPIVRSYHNFDRNQDIIANIKTQVAFFNEKMYKKDIEETKKTIGIVYSENHINQLIAEKSLEIIASNDIRNLPKKAIDIIENIKNDYFLINKHYDILNEDVKFNIENIWEKRVPEVINKYLRVDEEYRLSMKNIEDKNAEQLMIASLQNMNDILDKIKVEINTENLRDLSVTHRYTKKLK